MRDRPAVDRPSESRAFVGRELARLARAAGRAVRPCLRWQSLRGTLAVALVVGTVLFAINQLDIVLAGRATGEVWLKAGLTYIVPFLVANYGLVVGSRRR